MTRSPTTNLASWKTFLRVQRRRVASWAVLGSGALALGLGWFGVARAVYPAQQLPYLISGGLGGVCLVVFGALLWLSSDLEDEWTKLDLIEEVLHDLAVACPTLATIGEDMKDEHHEPARA